MVLLCPRVLPLPLLVALLVPSLARGQEPSLAGDARFELSLFAEATAYLGGGVRLDTTLGRWGPGRVSAGAELAAGHCARHCLRVYYGLFTPGTGQLDPDSSEFDLVDLLGESAGPAPGTPSQALLPSLRASYHLDFRRAGLLSLTDVYGLVLVGTAGLHSTFPDSPSAAQTSHSSWAPSVGAGVGVRQLFGERFFASLELRMRLGSGAFETWAGQHEWRVTAPGLTLAGGLSL